MASFLSFLDEMAFNSHGQLHYKSREFRIILLYYQPRIHNSIQLVQRLHSTALTNSINNINIIFALVQHFWIGLYSL